MAEGRSQRPGEFRVRRGRCAPATAAGLVALALLTGCEPETARTAPRLPVHVRVVTETAVAPQITPTGEIAARVQSDLSFRVAGQVSDRYVDVGAHVAAGTILARLDSKVQEADVDGAVAALQAAQARSFQVNSVFERQKALLAQGFTTRRDYDQAEQGTRSADAAVDGAKAHLATVRDQLGQTVLRAPSDGVVTARYLEVGQVVQPSMPVFGLAEDGPRDALINVQEVFLVAGSSSDVDIEVALVSDPEVRARGEVREIAPSVNATGAVRIKIAIPETPPEMVLGAAVQVTLRAPPRRQVILPWSALASDDGHPAVWVVDRRTDTVASRRIEIDAYHRSEIVVRDGLAPGEVVVTDGGQMLHPAQPVTIVEDRS